MKENRLIFRSVSDFKKRQAATAERRSLKQKNLAAEKLGDSELRGSFDTTRKGNKLKLPQQPKAVGSTVTTTTPEDPVVSPQEQQRKKDARGTEMASQEQQRKRDARDITTSSQEQARKKEIRDAGLFTNKTTGAITDQFGNEVDPNTLKPVQAPEEAIFKSQEEEARALVSGQLGQAADFEKELFGESSSPETIEDVLSQFGEDQADQASQFERQQERQQKQLGLQADEANLRGESQAAGIEAGLAQGRQGPVSGATAGTKDVFLTSLNNRHRQATIQRDETRDNLAIMEQDFRRAQKDGKTKLAANLKSEIALAQQDIREQEQGVLDSQAALLAEERAGMKEARTATDSTITNLESMGSAAGDLSPEQLESMIAGTNLNLAQATVLQSAAVLRGKAAETKDAAEAAKMIAQAEKMEKEADIVGQTNQELEFKFFDKLSKADQDAFMELKRSGVDNQLVDMGGGNYGSFNKKTNTFETVYTAPSGGAFSPSATSINDINISVAGSNAILDYTRIFKGSSANAQGVDFAAPVGTPVASQLEGTVTEVVSNCTPGDLKCNGGWGNQVEVTDGDGNVHTFNHLSQVGVQQGTAIGAGSSLGLSGNTGTVLAGDGSSLSQAQIDSGRGAHLDYTVLKPDGSRYTLDEAFKFANGEQQKGEGAKSQAEQIFSGTSSLTLKDIPQKERLAVDKELGILKQAALDTGDFAGVMRASAGGKDADQAFKTKLGKSKTVISQLGALNTALGLDEVTDAEGTELDISPLTKWAKEINPWNNESAEVNAILQGTIPNLARGVFGEVGVLTEADVELYRKTLPNLTQPEDIRKSIAAITLRTLRNSIEDTIEIEAASGVDMSGLAGFYTKIDDKVKEMEASLGITDEAAGPSDADILKGFVDTEVSNNDLGLDTDTLSEIDSFFN